MHDKREQITLNLRSREQSAFSSAVPVTKDKKRQLSRRRTPIATGAGLTLILACAALFLFSVRLPADDTSTTAVQGVSAQEEIAQQLTDFTYEPLGLSFSYRGDLLSSSLSERTSETIVRLTSQDQPVVISVRQETGLRTAAALSQTDTVSLLKNNIERSLPDRYPGFIELPGRVPQTASTAEQHTVFRYTGPSGESAVQHLVALVVDDDTAVYVSLQTSSLLYDTVKTSYFDPVLNSLNVE